MDRFKTLAAGLLFALAMCVTGLAVADPANNPAANETKNGVDVTEGGFAVTNGIPIKADEYTAKQNSRVVYSVYAPGLDSAETVTLASTVAMSRCTAQDLRSGSGQGNGNLNSPCEQLSSPYTYNPTVAMRVYRAPTATMKYAEAPNPVVLGTDERAGCSVKLHHCPVRVSSTSSGTKFGNQANNDYINVEAYAWNPGTTTPASNAVVELEGDCGDTTYGEGDYGWGTGVSCSPVPALDNDQTDRTKGMLGVDRKGDPVATQASKPLSTAQNAHVDIKTSGTSTVKPTVIATVPVSNVATDDVIDVRSHFSAKDSNGTTDPNHYLFEHSVESYWILTEDNDPTKVTPQGSIGRYISGRNGPNCIYDPSDGCVIQQAGSVRVPSGITQGGTYYAKLIVDATDMDAATPEDTYLKVLDSSNGPAFTATVECNSKKRVAGDPPTCTTP